MDIDYDIQPWEQAEIDGRCLNCNTGQAEDHEGLCRRCHREILADLIAQGLYAADALNILGDAVQHVYTDFDAKAVLLLAGDRVMGRHQGPAAICDYGADFRFYHGGNR